MSTAAPNRVQSYDKLLIGSKWVEPSTESVIKVIAPITGELLATIPEARHADVDAAVAAARKAFDEGPWPRMTPVDRAAILARVGDEIKRRGTEIAATITEELGAPTRIAAFIQQAAVGIWDETLTIPERFEFEQERTWTGGRGRVVHEPVGVVAAIIPWNGPLGAGSLKIAPALVAGCTVVLKPAPEAPLTTMMLAEALAHAGLPEGVISVLPADREVGEHLVRHTDIDKISFTGSTAAGKRIMAIAAENIKRVTLELGGKSAAIIADDIDLESFLPEMVFGGIGHSGQICAALTRILVPRRRQNEVVGHIKAIMENLKIGDPREADTMIGPLVAERQQKRVLDYIAIGQQEGARLATGGGKPAHLESGWYVEPTLFADVSNDMRIAREEIFGPVLVVIPFDTIDDAIAIANDSEYGLSGAVYAGDQQLAESIARQIRTGQISVNGHSICVVQPFGGYKQSGLGREGGLEGFHEFFETKLIQLP
jgi:acyl-CoA reductase-like NAD-dependent aldehyde dehydrogenase